MLSGYAGEFNARAKSKATCHKDVRNMRSCSRTIKKIEREAGFERTGRRMKIIKWTEEFVSCNMQAKCYYTSQASESSISCLYSH